MSWLMSFKKLEEPHARLFCFPHAGGGAQSYRDWSERFPNVEVQAINLPGRGSRQLEEPITDLPELVRAIVGVIRYQLNLPYAFFGHSWGSVLAYEVQLELQRQGLPKALTLFASSHMAPHKSGVEVSEWTHNLDDDKFVDVARRYGFIPEEALGQQDLLELMLPAFKADMSLHERYTYSSDTELLDCPVVAYGGATDASVSIPDILEWKAVTKSTFEMQVFAGGHFYTTSDAGSLLNNLESRMTSVIGALPLSIIEGPRVDYPEKDKCVHMLVEECAASDPDKEVIFGLQRTITYRTLMYETELLARKLQQRGVTTEKPVGIFIPHCEEYMIGNLGIFRAGGAMFLLESNYTKQMLQELIDEGGIGLVLTTSTMISRLPIKVQTEMSILLEGDWLAEIEAEADAGLLPALVDPGCKKHHLAYITMTSGTTGKPKAIKNTHESATMCFLPRYDLYPYLPGEKEGYNVFFAWESLRSICRACPCVIIPDTIIFDPPKLLDFIQRQGVTRLMVTPSLLQNILDYPGLQGQYTSLMRHMRLWTLEGEVVPKKVVQDFKRKVWGVGAPGGSEATAAATVKLAVPGEKKGDDNRVEIVNAYSTWESVDVAYGSLLTTNMLNLTTSKFAPVGYVIANVGHTKEEEEEDEEDAEEEEEEQEQEEQEEQEEAMSSHTSREN